jgi:hypothetical protein
MIGTKMTRQETTFSTEQTAEHLAALPHSVAVIDRLIEANERTPEALDEMDRNVRHIAIMCAMKHIKESGADLKPFTDAAAAGTAWMAA